MMDRLNREALFLRLYEAAFPDVARYIARRGGSFDEAKDIFHDALIVFYEKTAAGHAAVRSSEKAYVIGIAKHLWFRHLEQQQKAAQAAQGFSENDDAEQYATSKLLQFLETAGQKCMQLLQAFYYHGHSMHDIAQQFGFSGGRSATAQKYKCLQKVRDEVKKKSLTYEDFHA